MQKNKADQMSISAIKTNKSGPRESEQQEENEMKRQLLPKSDEQHDRYEELTPHENTKKIKKKKSEEKEKPNEQKNCIEKLKEKFFNQIQTTPRKITLNGHCTPPNHQTNLVKNTKYTFLTFVPKVLYNQFKFFFNLFFLLTALTQLIQILRVGLFITFIGPLAMVLSLTMAKEGYDDYRTYKRDIEANSKVYEVIRKKKTQSIKSKDLKIGDIVVIKAGDRIPADMVTLYSDNEQGTLFLKTDQLDGETDWKLRKAVKQTQNAVVNSNGNYHVLYNSNYMCEVKEPVSQIYSFQGVFNFSNNSAENSRSSSVEKYQRSNSSGSVNLNNKQRLTLEHSLWTSCVLTSGQIVGLVIYIGKQTRVALGASTPRTKVGILDHQINYFSKVLFVIMVILTTILVIFQRPIPSDIPIQFTRILILLSSIIPISMRVNLDFAKLFYASQINKDQSIKDTITRNSNCPEQLGRVKYILSDKTGTLTKNQMVFKNISIEDTIKFTHENVQEMKQILEDYENIPENIGSKQKYLKDIITALALCHNVTPVYTEIKKEESLQKQKQKIEENEEEPRASISILRKLKPSDIQGETTKDFQASSPDEITFVKIVESLGIQLKQRTQTEIKLKLASGKILNYDILYTFPFSSETKRMGIIVKNKQNNKITLYLKGADSIMKTFITNRQKQGFIDEECRDLSVTGLRTLVITKKQIKQEHFEQWAEKFQQANNRLEIDKQQIEKLMSQIENGVEFLGVTGIEDKLQNRLKQTIQSLKSADIKIWMITGDKVETAECISRSCGLQSITEENIKIQEIDNAPEWRVKWELVKQNLSKVLIIDGKTLIYVLDSGNKERRQDFFKTAMKMPAVICCRCSPQQKRTLTDGVKEFKNEKEAVLGIGDGGNDVGMIQGADIGVGIVGKQGKQAALAADFSILEFQNVKCLLLWHGRLSYKRSVLLASFIMHRGFIVSVIQFVFSCIFFFASIPVFNSYLQLGYATIFTFWPVFSLILDTDIDKKRALKYPTLYKSLKSSGQLQLANFLSWLWKAAVQGTLIMVLTIIFFKDQSYLQVETICFTILMLTEYCMTLSEIHRIHMFTLICVGGSLLCYALIVYFLPNVIHVSTLTPKAILTIMGITMISWGPLLVWKLIKRKFFPSDYEKVMMNVKRSLIAKKLLKSSIQSNEENKESMIHY